MYESVIAIDCDDVIANINDSVREFVNETQGFSYTADEYRAPGEHGWNMQHPMVEGMERVPNWQAVIEYFDRG